MMHATYMKARNVDASLSYLILLSDFSHANPCLPQLYYLSIVQDKHNLKLVISLKEKGLNRFKNHI